MGGAAVEQCEERGGSHGHLELDRVCDGDASDGMQGENRRLRIPRGVCCVSARAPVLINLHTVEEE